MNTQKKKLAKEDKKLLRQKKKFSPLKDLTIHSIDLKLARAAKQLEGAIDNVNNECESLEEEYESESDDGSGTSLETIPEEIATKEVNLHTIQWLREHGYLKGCDDYLEKVIQVGAAMSNRKQKLDKDSNKNKGNLYCGIQYPYSIARVEEKLAKKQPKPSKPAPVFKSVLENFKKKTDEYDRLVEKWDDIEKIDAPKKDEKAVPAIVKPGEMVQYLTKVKNSFSQGTKKWSDDLRTDSPVKSLISTSTSPTEVPCSPEKPEESEQFLTGHLPSSTPQNCNDTVKLQKLMSAMSNDSSELIKLKKIESLNEAVNTISDTVANAQQEIKTIANSAEISSSKPLKSTVQDIMKSIDSIKSKIKYPPKELSNKIINQKEVKPTKFIGDKTKTITNNLNRLSNLLELAKDVKKN